MWVSQLQNWDLWVLENFEPTNYNEHCSKHFLESDIIEEFDRIRLRENPIPPIFDFPEDLRKKTEQKKQNNIN